MRNIINNFLILTILVVLSIFTAFFAINKTSISYSFVEYIEPLGPPWQPVPTNDYTSQQYNLDLINAYKAWEIESGNSEIVVAIIDSGIDTDHEEFVGRISNLSYNAYTEEIGILAVEDDLGHGTNVAGIIGALRNNEIGIDGITDNVQLMIIKVNQPGEEGYLNSLIVKGIYYAVDNGADVINLSLGSTSADSGVKAAVEYAHENEVFVVAASGNDGNDIPYYPAAFTTTISVGSIDSSSLISEFSNYGITLDLVAPGDLLYTTDLENAYAKVSGTSFSAPHISAVLALLLSTGQFSYQEIYENIIRSTIDLGDVGKDIYYGYGLIDSYLALSTDLVQISFNTQEENEISPVWIYANQSYNNFSSSNLDNYNFIGWYLDAEYNIILTETYIFTEDTVLYAKYEPIYFQVTFIYQSEIYTEIIIQSGEKITLLPEIDEEGYVFYGWYYSENFEEKYIEQIISDNITLYAKIDELMYLITFLDAFDNFYQDFLVKPNQLFIPPEGPRKISDNLFDYEFISWDRSFEDIDDNMTVRPIYKQTLIASVAQLNPGVDTLALNDEWIDAGLYLEDDRLTFSVIGKVDTRSVGQYLIKYSITFEDEIVGELHRYVNVIEYNIKVEILLNKSITTLIVGNDYIETGASSSYGEVEIIGSVDSNKTGVYKITYQVSYADKIYNKHRYVYVIDADYIPLGEIDWFFEKGDEDE